MAVINSLEIGLFMKLFNRSGYVLNFSTCDFDVFTMESVGIPLCSQYGLSKGKSLMAFVNEADEKDVIKILCDLFEYYESRYEHEYTENDSGCYNSEYSETYCKCKKIYNRIKGISSPLTQTAYDLKDKFSSSYLSKQIDIMLKMQSENPTEAIGKAKELIESCCKTILEDNKIQWDKNWDVGQLAGETIKHLKLTPHDIPETVPAATEMKAILGNLRAIATNIAALRNPYGSGHGKSASYKGLEERHAKLAVGSAIIFVVFLWDTHERSGTNEVSV